MLKFKSDKILGNRGKTPKYAKFNAIASLYCDRNFWMSPERSQSLKKLKKNILES